MNTKLSKKIVNIPIHEIKDYDKNNKVHTKETIQELVENYKAVGIIDPIFIDENYVILAGHKRLLAAKKCKLKEVECYLVEGLDEAQKKIYRIASNKLTQNSQWDEYNLQQELYDIEKSYNVDALGFNFDFENTYASEGGGSSSGITQDTAPEPSEQVISSLGDLWILDNHRVLCGDSTDDRLIEPLLNGHKPLLMVTDPPYGVEYDPSFRENAGKGIRATGKVLNDDKADWSETIKLWNPEVLYMWHAAKYAIESVTNLLQNYDIITQIIWAKQHFALSRGDYHWQHEPCWYLVKKGCKHNWQGSRNQSSVWQIANLNSMGKNQDEDTRTNHSTQKPVECMANC